MLVNWFFLYWLSLWIFGVTGAVCPSGCICANNLIVCTCNIKPSTPVLGSFRGIEYISKIYIHSCPTLNITADTFNGLAVGQELNIMNIDHLYLEPYAFREMLKYPDHFTIKDSGIEDIAEHAFSGFTRSKHIWLRNVTIGTIRKGAFKHVSHVEYVYFRESTIKTLESEAFSFMSSLAHLFIRGKVKIGQVGDHIFRRSSIANIMFEDVTVNCMTPYSFAGASYFGAFEIQNCTLLDTNVNTQPKTYYQTENGQKLEIMKTIAENFSVSWLSHIHHIRVDECQFERVIPGSSFREGIQPLTNVSVLYFTRTLINYMLPYAFGKTKNVQSIMFDDCAIATIHSSAFDRTSNVGHLILLNSKVIKLEENSFSDTEIENFVIEISEVDVLESKLFRGSKINSLKFIASTFETVSKSALGRLKSEYVGLENCKFNKLSQEIFDELRSDVLNITDNMFNSISEETFSGAISYRRLLFNYNKFPCQCNSITTELLDFNLDKDVTSLSSITVSPNFCSAITSSININKFIKSCPNHASLFQTFTMDENRLKCRKKLLWTTCVCHKSGTITVTAETASRLVSRQTSGLTFSDCNKIRFATKSFLKSEFSHLMVVRSNLEFESEFLFDAPYLRTVTVEDCTVEHLPANVFAQKSVLDSIEFINTTIYNVDSDSLKFLHTKQIRFAECRIGEIHAKFAAGGKLENLTMSNCQIGRINSGAFNDSLIAALHVVNSNLTEVRHTVASEEFLRNTFVCFVTNKFSCQCDIGGVKTILNANGCDDSENVCSNPNTLVNKKVTDVLKENLDARVYKTSKGCFDEPYNKQPVPQLSHSSSSSMSTTYAVFALSSNKWIFVYCQIIVYLIFVIFP